jgi:hypothetical protein
MCQQQQSWPGRANKLIDAPNIRINFLVRQRALEDLMAFQKGKRLETVKAKNLAQAGAV